MVRWESHYGTKMEEGETGRWQVEGERGEFEQDKGRNTVRQRGETGRRYWGETGKLWCRQGRVRRNGEKQVREQWGRVRCCRERVDRMNRGIARGSLGSIFFFFYQSMQTVGWKCDHPPIHRPMRKIKWFHSHHNSWSGQSDVRIWHNNSQSSQKLNMKFGHNI